ncbi:Ribosomal large subunit pseudouridine synthase B [Enhygromyxa salina]|uniref:Pseudouridine synthase n=1 Tax=Enhygromyxa salina TaxID=215803 RepID=A0A0C1ZE55_9BACT|nr:pseudouridine synthase [Enhygromyxa salina]KIG15954.1 Ribosomal large subunit pseudouridine synthase B [Enhygromyxa salina]
MANSRAPKSRSQQPRVDSGSSSGRRRAGSRDAGPDKSPTRGPSSRGPKKTREQPFTPNERELREGVRLQKFIASAGICSRRKAEDLIASGVVQVNGQRVKELGSRVFPGRDRVTVRGEPVVAEAKVYYLLNKPDQIVCDASGSVDERGRATVLSLMHGIPERLYPVGRLDYHSRGILLLTNDGELAAALSHPRHGVVKTYHVKFQGKLSPDQEQLLRDGVELDDGAITRPLVELFAFRETEANVWYQVGLAQGLNRQLRRMGEAIGRPVLKLIRVAIGDINADGLPEGEFRPLTATEVGRLLASVKLDPPAAPPKDSRKSPRKSASGGAPGAGQRSARGPGSGQKSGPANRSGARGGSSSRGANPGRRAQKK